MLGPIDLKQEESGLFGFSGNRTAGLSPWPHSILALLTSVLHITCLTIHRRPLQRKTYIETLKLCISILGLLVFSNSNMNWYLLISVQPRR
ncbi:uncharacterized protein BO72DRAFT_170424 [Aspergillus fijiensis CBS 313.89]|uniref:Uncharacterized protein n=1 Tax=Aspergillus fijiensis CBS 313.89 TaxID=1448319 RepID=A0A8G1RLE0_9EURO|nr:uncharacterized protein BO72DRAFT_170424 [Aspergillus fijiensis CBS 313.89]RAK75399.1 hypothetical protein BO72DRAFT_170424 [Aspergillus fijiensis CBS 313.89]